MIVIARGWVNEECVLCTLPVRHYITNYISGININEQREPLSRFVLKKCLKYSYLSNSSHRRFIGCSVNGDMASSTALFV